MQVEAVNGPVGVGDLIAYPGQYGLVTARVSKIVMETREGYNGTVTSTRVHVLRTHWSGRSWHNGAVLRNPKNIAVLEKASQD